MEKINGRIQKGGKQSFTTAVGIRGIGRSHPVRLVWLALFSLSIAGCSLPKLKSSLITGIATSTAVGVTSVVAPGVLVPAAVGGTTAVIASALTAAPSVKGESIEVTAETVVQEAPDNFFSLIHKLIEMGGWLLILIFVVPMVIGWILPGPLEKRKKKSLS